MRLSLLPWISLACLCSPQCFADVKVDCVAVDLRIILPSSPEETEQRAEIKIINDCGKDITAYSVRNADGGEFRVDMLPMLSMENGEILRAGQSMTQSERAVFPVNGTPVVFVNAVMFLDRTTAGDPAAISLLLERRKQHVPEFHAQYEFLNKISDYNEAQKILINKEPASDGPMVRLTWAQASMLLGAPEKYWNEYVEREKASRLRLLSLYQEHSTPAPQ